MEFTVRLDSSLWLGLVTGGAVGAALAVHLSSRTKCSRTSLGGYFCPWTWIDQVKSCCRASTVPAIKQASACPFASKSSNVAAAVDSKRDDEEEERAADRNAMWFMESISPVLQNHMVLKSVLFDGRSEMQRVQVIETEQFGRTLVMDGQTQSAQADEHVYHESLVHPAMLLHTGGPKNVFIGGGGEFATAREVLRHNTVQRCVMVDIDKLACDMCREQLPEWNAGAFEDPRFHIEYLDARKWLEDNDEMFDVIIMDICDPIEAGPGYRLYTREFYEFLHTKLNPGGVFVTQSGPCAIYNAQEECFTVIHNTLKAGFDVVVPYAVDIPSFGCPWGFNLAFAASDPEAAKTAILNGDITKFNNTMEHRVMGGAAKLRFLDGVSWRGLMGIPKEVRKQCEEEDRVMTIDNPVFMYSG